MSQANVNKTINASAEAVWEHLSDFTAIKVGGPIESFSYEGEGVGTIRQIGIVDVQAFHHEPAAHADLAYRADALTLIAE